MKFNWNKKYTTYAIYASVVLAAVIFCIFVGVYIKNIWSAILFVLNVFAPLMYGAIIAYILMPILNLFEKRVFFNVRHAVVRRGLGVTLTVIFVAFIGGLLVYAIFPQIARSTSDLQTSLVTYSASLQEWVNGMASKNGIVGTIFKYLTSVIDFDVLSQPITYIIELLYELLKDFSPYIMNILSSFVVQLKNIVLGAVFAGYLMCSKELVFAQINKAMCVVFSEKTIAKIKSTVRYTDSAFGKYIKGMLVDAVIVGTLTAVAMLIFKIPYVPLISVIVACTNIIPIFGPFIGAIPSFLFIFVTSPVKALVFIIIILVIQQVDGNLIAPRVLGNATGLPAIGVIIAITVMGGFFGVIGMVIGVPVFAVLGKFLQDKTDARTEAKRARGVIVEEDMPDAGGDEQSDKCEEELVDKEASVNEESSDET